MDLSLQVAPAKESLHTRSISEALLYAENTTVSPLPRTLGDLEFGNPISITDKLQGEVEETKMTRKAVMDLCRILRIPDPFVRSIPNDLLLTNIKRLQGIHSDQKVVLLLRPDKVVAGIVKKKYNEVPYIDVLGALESKPDIQYIDIGENLLTVCFAHKEKTFKDPLDKDGSIYMGSYLYSSILATKPLHLRVGLYRTLCSNSFVGISLGTLKADYKQDPEPRMLRFAEQVGYFDEDVMTRFEASLDFLHKNTMYMHELAATWTRLKNAIGPVEADRCIDYTEDSRKDLLKSVSVWKNENKRARLLGQSVLDPVPSDRTLFSVMNAATTYAHNLSEMDRYRLEVLAGKSFEQFILN